MKWKTLFGSAASASNPPVPEPAVPKPAPARPALVAAPTDAVLFHITHAKAASQWMRGILEELFGPAVVPPEYHGRQIWGRPIEAGRVYTCFNIGQPEFDKLTLPAEGRRFILLRDLRDTLVSAYFSLRYSHETGTSEVAYYRLLLNQFDQEEGLLYLAETWLPRAAWIQRTWLEAGAPVFRIEECVQDAPRRLGEIFRTCWKLELDPKLLEQVAARHSFAKLSGGRPPGQEDSHSHYRKGVAGDWRNYFTPRLARRFGYLYNDVLMSAGYESRANWVEQLGPQAASPAPASVCA